MGAMLVVLGAWAPSWAEESSPFQQNIERGRAFLFVRMKEEKRLGYLALGTMALLKTAPMETEGPRPNRGHARKTAELQALVDRFVREVEANSNAFRDQEGTYTLAVTISCLVADDPGKHERLLRRLVDQLLAAQRPNGSWTYPSGSPASGDTSQTQYATLALWDAARVGINVPLRVWDAALAWQIRTQDGAGIGGPGGFVYQPSKIPDDGQPVDQGEERGTMGVAGLSTLLICQNQLPGLRQAGKGPVLKGDLVRAADDPNEPAFTPRATAEAARAAIERAQGWVARNSIFQGPFKDAAKVNYYLYGFERVAALKKRVNDPIQGDWYRHGGEFLARAQKADGRWSMGSHWTDEADTAFALLFLKRVTERVVLVDPIDVMPRSRAVGGEGGLPAADGATTGGAIERMIQRHNMQPKLEIDALVKFLDGPDAVPEETLAQVEQLSPEQINEVVRKAAGDPRRLRQWAYDKRPEARRVALTLLARSRDLRFAPVLLDGLREKDAGVYTAARDGLRYVSRNVEVFGLPPADQRTPDAVKVGIERATAWFRELKIEAPANQDFAPPRP